MPLNQQIRRQPANVGAEEAGERQPFGIKIGGEREKATGNS